MILTTYKLVQKTSDKGVFSSYCVKLPQDLVCFYALNETTYPKYGRLYCFRTLKQALDYLYAEALNHQIFNTIFVCEGHSTDVGRPKYVYNFRANELSHRLSYRGSSLEIFFKERNNHKYSGIYSYDAPDGTLTCSSFTPIRIFTSYYDIPNASKARS